MPFTPRRLFTAGVAGLVLAGAFSVPATATAPVPDPTVTTAAARSATTSDSESRRVDRVATPALHWYSCYGWAQCTTAQVPLDYDRPWGEQTTVALLRVKATDQKHKIGSLFVNPGGPGASATTLALAAPFFLSDALLTRFDIVGMDPRGVGFSYGSALGQYYANMFPDRFRTLAVDGTIYPRAWAGSRKTQEVVQDDRLRSADGAYRALMEILKRCSAAGPTKCAFAGTNVAQKFRTIAGRLKKEPVTILSFKFTYADFIGLVLGELYSPTGGDEIAAIAAELWTMTSTGSATAKATAAIAYAKRLGRSFPYDNSIEAYAAVMCTDGLHPAKASSWRKAAAAADRRAPYFGRAWAWASVPCAGNAWQVRDEDAYRGPFNRRTGNTVLIVGSYWDPATNYADAVKSAKSLPNSRLLSSDNWGHTAYGTSSCADKYIDQYLLYKDLPAKGAVCTGDDQPFTETLEEASATSVPVGLELRTASKAQIAAYGLPAPGTPKQLPPVAAGR